MGIHGILLDKCGTCAPVSKLTARNGNVQCRETHEAGPRAIRHTARPRRESSGAPGCILKAGTPLTGNRKQN